MSNVSITESKNRRMLYRRAFQYLKRRFFVRRLTQNDRFGNRRVKSLSSSAHLIKSSISAKAVFHFFNSAGKPHETIGHTRWSRSSLGMLPCVIDTDGRQATYTAKRLASVKMRIVLAKFSRFRANQARWKSSRQTLHHLTFCKLVPVDDAKPG